MANITSVRIDSKETSKVLINGGIWFQKDDSPTDAYINYNFEIEELSAHLSTFKEDINNDNAHMPGETLNTTYRAESSQIREEVNSDTTLTASEKQSLLSSLDALDQEIEDVNSLIQVKTTSAEENYNIALEAYNAAVQQVYDNVYVEEDYQSPTVQGYIEEARVAHQSLSDAVTLYNMYVGYAETPEFPF